jgi:hypothetical protein
MRLRRDDTGSRQSGHCVGARDRYSGITMGGAFDGIARRPEGGVTLAGAGLLSVVPKRAMDRILTMARTSFSPPEARIVVSSDGYFDVYPTTARTNGDKPAYRGVLAELGQEIRGTDDRLAVRPNSVALADAVTAWSAVHGAAALGGALGRGRDGNESAA